MAVELTVLAPTIALLIGFVIVAGRLSGGHSTVQAAANDAARMASISRTPADAQAAARAAAEQSLRGQAKTCGSYTVVVDTSGFSVPVGQPAQVSATVNCEVPLAGLLPGLPGSRTVSEQAISPLDTYRERS
jgi:Flp pilus assembly protein TadG